MKRNFKIFIYVFVMFSLFFLFTDNSKAYEYRTCYYKNDMGLDLLGVTQKTTGEIMFTDVSSPEEFRDHFGDSGVEYYKIDVQYLSLDGNRFLVDGVLDCKAAQSVIYAKETKFLGFKTSWFVQHPQMSYTYALYNDDFEFTDDQNEAIGTRKTTLTAGETTTDKIDPGERENADCGDIFGGEFGKLLKNVLNLIRFFVPIIVVILAVVEFIKAIASQNQDQIKKSFSTTIKRLIIGFCIFLFPTLLFFILELASDIVCKI